MMMLDTLVRTSDAPGSAMVDQHASALAVAGTLAGVEIGINAVSLMSPLTGIGQYTFHLVRQLHALKLAPWLFYGTGWGKDIRTAALPGIGTAKDLFKRMVPRPYVAMRYMLGHRFAGGVRRHKIRLYHDPNFMAYRFDGPTVVTVHDLSWVRYPETHPAERVREMNRLMPETVQKAAHILVDSEFIRQEVIEHFGVAPESVTTALLGVTPEFRPMTKEACRPVLTRYGLEHGRYVLAVGTLEPRKNLSSVIAAFSRLPDSLRARCPLVVVGMQGWGEDRYSKELRDLIRRGEACMAGYVPQAELPSLYAGARMLVYPSLYEGFGLPPLEAMACGIPVIASNRASLPEVVGDAGLQVEPLDVDALTRGMLGLAEDEGLHQELSLAGRDRASSFTWEKCAFDTLRVYQRAVSRLPA